MDIGAYIAASGAIASSKSLEMVTHNLANAVTPGFKQVMARNEAFPFALPQRDTARGDPLAFVRVSAPARMGLQGTLERTEQPLDIALEGEGSFRVLTPRGVLASRDGRLQVASDGRLVSREGYPVLDDRGEAMRLEAGGKVEFGPEGDVLSGGAKAGNLGIVDASGLPVSKGDFRVVQGSLESSNVKPVEEMVQILELLRGYQSYIKMMEGFSDLEEKTVLEMGRV